MKQKTCPFKAGASIEPIQNFRDFNKLFSQHEEHADNINIGNYATIFDVPPEFLGEWRIYYSITTLRRGTFVEECIMTPVSVLEL